MAKPFTVQHVLELQGGHLTKPLKISCETVSAQCFTYLRKTDAGLARALGFPTPKNSSPFANVNIFEYLTQVRNEKVDKLIRDHLLNQDSMADHSCTIDIAQEGRLRLFDDAKIPQVISVEMPPFISPEGRRVDARSIDMIATPRRNVSPCVEASAELFEWILHACHHTWPVDAVPKRKRCPSSDEDAEADLPELPEPVKYLDVAKDKIVLKVYYKKDTSKKWHMKSKHLNISVFNSDLTCKARDDAILAMAGILKEYYEKSHTPALDKPPEDDAEPEEGVEPDHDASNKGDE